MRHANDNVLEGEPKRTESQAQTPPWIGDPLVICTQISMLIISWHIFKYTEEVCIIYSFLCPQNEYLMSLSPPPPEWRRNLWIHCLGVELRCLWMCLCFLCQAAFEESLYRVGKTFLTEAKTRQHCVYVLSSRVWGEGLFTACWIQRWTHFKECVQTRFDSDLVSVVSLMRDMEFFITGGEQQTLVLKQTHMHQCRYYICTWTKINYLLDPTFWICVCMYVL